MQTPPAASNRRAIFTNISWFVGSLGLAFLVWMLATSQLDPVSEWRWREPIPIRVTPDTGLVITNEADFARTANLLLRAQQSVRELLAADDIIITADLTGLGPGTHVVELDTDIARRVTVVDTSPSRITVNLEVLASKLVEVRPVYVGDLPPGYEIKGEPIFDVNQVTVSGPQSRVDQVAAVQVEIDIDGQRERIEDDARPVPVDPDGRPVSNVTVDTQIIRVTVEIGPVGEATPTPSS